MRGALAGKQRLISARRWAQHPRLCSLYENVERSSSFRVESTSSGGQGAERMDPQVRALVERLHQTPHKAVLYATGGGSQALSWLLAVPGASSTVLEASVPYSRGSLVDILGYEPAQYCCQQTAIEMAKAAYRRAANLTTLGTPVVGISATCSLATANPKRGEHHAHVAAHTGLATHVIDIKLSKDSRSRWQEDDIVSRLILQAAAASFELQLRPGELELGLLQPGDSTAASQMGADNALQSQLAPAGVAEAEQPAAAPADATAAVAALGALPGARPLRFVFNSAAAAASSEQLPNAAATDVLEVSELKLCDPLAALLEGQVRSVEFSQGLVLVDAPRRGRVYLPGSFNPVHAGHVELLQQACAMAGPEWEGCFELSVGNADKGQLALEEVRRRVDQLVQARLPLVVTAAPLFVQKADLFPRSKFVVGFDTAARLVMPKYHNGSLTEMLIEFGRFRHLGCSFIVAGRKDDVSGHFKALEQASVPEQLQDLFAGLTEQQFRKDISSTEIRRRMSEQLSGEDDGRGSGGGSCS